MFCFSQHGMYFLFKGDALTSLVQKNDSNLSDGQQNDLLNLILQYQDIIGMGKAVSAIPICLPTPSTQVAQDL